MSNWRISLSDLDYGPEEEEAVLRVLRSKWLSMGPEVQAFEAEFAAMQGAEHAIAVANATAGLHLAFLALGLGPGDEVIQPAINFVAAANMTVAVGATPVFADICSLSEPTIDPAHVESLITPNTKAVVAMHYGGYLCRTAELERICNDKGIALIEDACHAVGAHDSNRSKPTSQCRMAGSIGDIGAFSFFANKNLSTGEGGMVVTNRDDLAERVRRQRSHGMTTMTWDRHQGHASTYDVINHGYNYRLDEIRAALGRAQLAKLKRNNERRRQLSELYRSGLSSLAGWTIPFSRWTGDTSAHLMVLVAPTMRERDRARKELGESGIQTSLHYPCICAFSAFSRWQGTSVPLSRQFAQQTMTLPMHPLLSDSDVRDICSHLQFATSTAG